MRNFLQTKLSEDHADKVKTKEKSSILFNELVRIGQQSEAQQRQLQGLNHALEERIAVLESRLHQSESNNQMVNRKRMKIQPSSLAGDLDFLRRLYLDLTGLPPTDAKVASFLDDKRPVLEKRNELIDECRNAAASCKTLIFTSEHFQSRLRGIEEIQRLKKLIEELASRIRIIIYIRDPLDTAVSLLSTAIKGGGSWVGLPSPQQKSIENLGRRSDTQ